VEEGETLLQIDPSDYRTALQQRKSELRQAKADLKLEMGRQDVAQQDYQLLADSLTEANRALVLRKPQLNAARSQVESARAAVEQAKLNLQRTTITAPFDAHIVDRNVNVGSQVAPGDNLGRLVGRETYWVEATVPLSKLRWLRLPTDGNSGAPVRVRNRTAWPEGTHRAGELFRVVGALEEQTRMARVLIEVPDPLASRTENADRPTLMIGSYVETQIRAEPLENVVRLNRDYVRDDETVWVMADNTLHIRDAKIVFRDARYAYVAEGLNDGDQVVTNNLSTVRDGAPLRLEGSEEQPVPNPAQE
jgi:RND family efflux transporter MFP subunit